MLFAPVVAAMLSAALALPSQPPAASLAHASTLAHRLEVARIQLHFDSVLAVLPAIEHPGLTPGQLVRRHRLFETLQQYRDAGVFPHNRDYGRQPVPYFIDRESATRCAVAFLMESTGRRDIVERVAAADNNVYVAELAGDTAFTGWLDAHGLTLAEAAWIQVPYVDDGSGQGQLTPAVRSSYGAVSLSSTAAATTLALVNSFTNRDGHGRSRNWAGLALGGISLGVAALGASSDAPGALVAGNAVAGAFSLLSSAHGIISQRRIAQASTPAGERRVVTSVAPVLPSDRAGAGAQVAFAVSF